MAYVTRSVLAAAEALLGTPRELTMTYEITPQELAMVRASQRHGRAHDVTTFIFADPPPDSEPVNVTRLAVIAKHSYPPGAYRVPGGGLEPGEALIAGAQREALEETGLSYTVECYPLRIAARFTCGTEHLDWTTHIVGGTAPSVPPAPRDTHEIREARWIAPAALSGPIARALLATGRPLFAYRVALHRVALAALLSVPGDEQPGG